MKILPFFTAVLLASSLATAVQAEVNEPTPQPAAAAMVETIACVPTAAAPCAITGSADTAHEAEADGLPPANVHQQAIDDAATPVPEPQTFIMLMLGLVILGFASRRRHKSERFHG